MNKKITINILLISFMFGALMWVVQAVINFYYFRERVRALVFGEPLNFLDSMLFHIPPYDLFVRLSFVTASLLAGIIIAIVFNKYHKNRHALAESELKYRSYIENSPEAIFVTDKNGKYTDVNDAAELLTGYSRKELLGMYVPQIVDKAHLEEAKRDFEALVKNGKSKVSIPFLRKDRGIRHCIVSTVKISDDAYIGFCKDISDIKKAEEALRKKNKELEQTLDDFYVMRTKLEEDMKLGIVQDENRKIKERINELKQEE